MRRLPDASVWTGLFNDARNLHRHGAPRFCRSKPAGVYNTGFRFRRASPAPDVSHDTASDTHTSASSPRRTQSRCRHTARSGGCDGRGRHSRKPWRVGFAATARHDPERSARARRQSLRRAACVTRKGIRYGDARSCRRGRSPGDCQLEYDRLPPHLDANLSGLPPLILGSSQHSSSR